MSPVVDNWNIDMEVLEYFWKREWIDWVPSILICACLKIASDSQDVSFVNGRYKPLKFYIALVLLFRYFYKCKFN